MLEKPGYGWHSTPAECAAELQRLQSENDTLRAGYDAARLEIESLQAQAQQCGAGAGCCAQAARIEELQAQLEAVGAGGVGPLLGAPVGVVPFALLVRKKSWNEGQWECAPSGCPEYGRQWADERVWVYTAPQPAAQALDSVRVFWQQHTPADALSMEMAELHADAERAIRAALAAPAQAAAQPATQAQDDAVAQAVAVEREACAQLAAQTVCDLHIPTGVKIYGARAAKAIRARGTDAG